MPTKIIIPITRGRGRRPNRPRKTIVLGELGRPRPGKTVIVKKRRPILAIPGTDPGPKIKVRKTVGAGGWLG